ncbi:IS110 family transposase [Mesorhizobium sp.]|uniref:IS110 family transposase n=1 Tax=Mesorhizobium sp. TaxID=1871066 RepID=UPI0025E07281|nr:IS110 family transposase [Mesorhizobium sp.]
MEFFCGLDVAMDETAVCVVDDHGAVHLETTAVTDPDTLFAVLKPFLPRLRRVGHEAGSLSPWLHPELKKLGLPAVCLETQHVRAAMSAQRNKTDKADALGIAHIMRTGWFRQAHIKSQSCHRTKLLLTHRRNLAKFLDLENHTSFAEGVRYPPGQGGARGLRAGGAHRGGGRSTVVRVDGRHAVGARRAVEAVFRLHDLVVKMVARSELCRRFMAIPGVGPVTALSFMTAIDDPSRFRRSRDVAAYFGLTSRRWQSGTSIDVQGRISKAGDADERRSLYEAASGLMTRFKGRDKVKSWGQAIAKRSCHRKACVAVARKLAVIMHAMWSDGTFYVGDSAASQADAGRRAHDKARKLLGAHR